MKINKRLFGFLLSLALALVLLPGMTVYADFYATEITDYCPIMDKNGSITKYKVSVEIYDTRHSDRKVRLMFVPTGHDLFPERFLTGGVNETQFHLSSDQGPTTCQNGGYAIPRDGNIFDLSSYNALDTLDIDIKQNNNYQNHDFEVENVSLDTSKTYEVWFIARVGNGNDGHGPCDFIIYTNGAHKTSSDAYIALLSPLKINYQTQNSDGSYSTKVINSHYISGKSLDVSSLGEVPTGYHLNTSASTSTGTWDGTSEVKIVYDLDSVQPELTDEQKPKAKENLTDTGEPQELVTPPEKLPDGYQKVQYSIDGGETWTDEVPKGTKTGSYTVKVKYVASDGNHTDFFGEDILVTIGTAMNIRVDLINLLYNGQRTLPKEIKELKLEPIIHIALDETESVSRNLTFDLEQGMDNPKKYEKVEFTAKVEDLAPGKYEVTVTGLPKVVYGQEDDIYSADDGMIEGRVLWKYALTAKAEINVKKDSGTNKEETVITVYLIWDDGSRPDEIKVYALPEDEIGAYALRADGTKEYLLFHTYDICMNYLGRDELCRGYERCFHKESPYVNPFVQP